MQSTTAIALVPLLISVIDFFAAYIAAVTENAFQWAGQPPNCPVLLGDLDPYLIHGSLGPPESTLQSASRSVHETKMSMFTQFLVFCLPYSNYLRFDPVTCPTRPRGPYLIRRPDGPVVVV